MIFISSVVGLYGGAGPGQLRGQQGRPGRHGPVDHPRAGQPQHHRQRGGARVHRDRHDRRAARGDARRRSSRRSRPAGWPTPDEVAGAVTWLASDAAGVHHRRRHPGRRRPRHGPLTARASLEHRQRGASCPDCWPASGCSITGVITDASIAFSVARLAQEQGATVVLTGFGRLSLVERIAKRLPEPAPVIELDVTNPEHLDALADKVREHVDGLDGVLHSIAFAPQSCLGGGFLDAPWEDVATALHVSTYSYKSLAIACLPLMGAGGSHRRARPSTPPRPGRSTTGWAWPRPAWSRRPATWRGTWARRASGSTWSRPARCAPWRPSRSPGFDAVRGRVGRAGAAGLGPHRPGAGRPGLLRAAVRLVPGHHRRDRARRRRLPRARRRPDPCCRQWTRGLRRVPARLLRRARKGPTT